ncbi:CopG family ribbon-helix-helix protein [Falsiroseomonas oryziterrae]|uniref:CopG family ribbon-helix-helix protein n=1 Tax=Falsiroseomonas oryziterrae TaxID=2911368 RepID=UPI001F219854|nr:hypothetical protein [Roseomonas sp. NPKOSM-4]
MVRISVDLPEELARRLHLVAGETQSTPEALLREAAEAMLADRDALARSIARGRADADAGRVASHDEVMAELDAWVEDLEARQRAAS